MPRTYRPQEVIKVLEYLGWRVARVRGDHVQMTKEGQPSYVTVPVARRELKEGTMHSILRQAGLNKREFEKFAKEVL